MKPSSTEQQPVSKGARVLSCLTAIHDHEVITSFLETAEEG